MVSHMLLQLYSLSRVAGRRSQDDASCDLRLAVCEKEIVKCLVHVGESPFPVYIDSGRPV